MIFICGSICSGKTLYGKALAQGLSSSFIDVSSIVRRVLNTQTREKLQDSASLDGVIIQELKKYQNTNAIIAGVRQLSILKAFDDVDSTFIWLEASEDLRLSRYLNRKDKKDFLTKEDFLEAERRDLLLGFGEIKKFIFERNI